MPRRATVYMSIDPGLANTGIVVCKKGKGGALVLIHAEKFTTKKVDKDRIGIIREHLKEIALRYHVTRCVCETFEVRPWESNKSYAVAMCKVINGISEEFYRLQIPFVLSSPANKKGLHLSDMPLSVQNEINSRPKTHREHLTDAYIHLYYQVNKRGN